MDRWLEGIREETTRNSADGNFGLDKLRRDKKDSASQPATTYSAHYMDTVNIF
jgi:hypothetical protein